MNGSSPAERVATGAQSFEPHAFLDSHRALAACAREFTRLANDVSRRATELASGESEIESMCRLSPGRCIVQFGPVALTLAWLRSTLDSVSEGQLLVIVWRGVVAPRADHRPERLDSRRAPLPATALWEKSFVVDASSEATWVWRPDRESKEGHSSPELASIAVERLRVAFQANLPGD
jgi:hypothetical protein